MTGRRRFPAIVAIALAWPLAAAAWPPYRLHPQYEARSAALRTVGVVVPGVTAYQGKSPPVLRPDWAEKIRANLLASVEAALRRRQLAVKRVDPSAEGKEELRAVQVLYQAVGSAIVEATYANSFAAKKGRGFDYTVGDVSALLAAEGVDALVFTYALTFNGAMGDVPDRVYLGMVDRSGAVVWFSHDASTLTDLRDPESADLFVNNLVDPLPRRTR